MKLEYGSKSQAFPATCEVDWELYAIDDFNYIWMGNLFPAPLEVDRYLYRKTWEK